MIKSDTRFAWLYAFVVFVLTACATVEPLPPEPQPVPVITPEAVVAPKPIDLGTARIYAPGTVLHWAEFMKSEKTHAFRELVVHSEDDYMIFADLSYTELTDATAGQEEFFVFFSGLLYADCVDAAKVPMDQRQLLIDFWSDENANVTVTSTADGRPLRLRALGKRDIDTLRGTETVRRVEEKLGTEEGVGVMLFTDSDLEFVGSTGQSGAYTKLEKAVAGPLDPALQLRAMSACQIPSLETPETVSESALAG